MIEVTQANYQSKLWRLTNLYKIKNKNRELVNFKPNAVQKDILKSVAEMSPLRSIVLKSRQVGVSTLWILYFLDDCIFRAQTTTGVLCHKIESLSYLASIIKTAVQNLPKSLVDVVSETRSKFAFGNGSQILLSLEFRSTALNNLHISEMAFAETEKVRASMAAVVPDGNISIESTPNGIGDFFHEMYTDAKENKNGFKSFFAPWFTHHEYVFPLNGMKVAPTAEEVKLKLAPEQILFRRSMMERLKRDFKIEFPEDDVSCFFASGSNFFDVRKISVLLKEAKKFDEKNPPLEKTENLIVWEKPQKDHTYVLGADPAEGFSGDFSAFKILCLTCESEAAAFRGHVGVDHFAKIIDQRGRQFNDALVAVERNNHGHAVNLALAEIFRYPNIYSEKRMTRMSDTPREKQYGFLTTSLSKTRILDDLKLAIEGDSSADEVNFQPQITIHDQWLLNECLNFKQDGVRLTAPSGKFDDMVMASSISFQMFLNSRSRPVAEILKGVFVGMPIQATKL